MGCTMENAHTSVDKAVDLLEQLAMPPYEYKPAELAALTGLNRSSVYRLLGVLRARELVACDSSGERFKIGSGLYHIGTKYLYNNNFHSVVQNILDELSGMLKESVGMAVWDSGRVISLMEVELHQPMKLNDYPGRYFPINKGCYGKTLAAYQPTPVIEEMIREQQFEKSCRNTLTTREELLEEYAKIRRQGYTYSVDEVGIDTLGVGIPLTSSDGRVRTCVAAAFYRTDGWMEKMERCREILLEYQPVLEKNIP